MTHEANKAIILKRYKEIFPSNSHRDSDKSSISDIFRTAENKKKISVFVHLAQNKDVNVWREAWAAGKLVGINDETPYGYGRANAMGCIINFSKNHSTNLSTKLLRVVLRGILGFDIVHAWHQRREFGRSDIIWTHTESQFLAAAAILLLTRQRTKLLGQVVWLMDKWDRLSIFHKWLYRHLIARTTIMTFLSPDNHRAASLLFPKSIVKVVPFGIPTESTKPVKFFSGKTLNILALGNDMHRDWKTLVNAVAGDAQMRLTILSGSAPRHLMKYGNNIEIRAAKSNVELYREFENADIICVPLKSNLHASGITVIQEAILYGIPVVATATGGLDLYFSQNEISYVPVGDIAALKTALHSVIDDPTAAKNRAVAAQMLMSDSKNYGAQAYIEHHVLISRQLLNQ